MNKYVLDKRKSIIKLNTDTLDLKYIDTVKVEKGDVVLLMYRIGNEKEGDLIVINNNDLNNYFERKKKFLEEMEKQKCTEKVCRDCDLKCECTSNY